jgi:hypothetical protein
VYPERNRLCGRRERLIGSRNVPTGPGSLWRVKNRTNRLFGRVVEYEMIQVQVYLQMLGLVHARLVEQYNTQVVSHDITRDEEMWAKRYSSWA